ncbi:hypothetical protein [Hymenobacter algoricola]|uniref:Uncharacterized protein n=1 Tax=Hymenobacter algoricola TaxID=486267 RepID=A0ABP7N8Z6_9BACT
MDIEYIIKSYGPLASTLGAAIAFVWTIIQFVAVRTREAQNREFEVFHRLIKELVEPPTPDGALYVDRQCAIIYELRFFSRYHPVTKRTLLGLQVKWGELEGKYERLLDEISTTLKYLDSHRNKLRRVVRFFWNVNY